MRIEVLPILLTACCGPSAAFTFHRPSNLIYQRTEPIALFSTTETETFDREVVGSQEKDVSMWRKAYRKTIVRGYKSLFSKQRSKKELKIGIAGFYDRSSQLWEEVWVGFYSILISLNRIFLSRDADILMFSCN